MFDIQVCVAETPLEVKAVCGSDTGSDNSRASPSWAAGDAPWVSA